MKGRDPYKSISGAKLSNNMYKIQYRRLTTLYLLDKMEDQSLQAVIIGLRKLPKNLIDGTKLLLLSRELCGKKYTGVTKRLLQKRAAPSVTSHQLLIDPQVTPA